MTPAPDQLDVVLVEDHPTFRLGLRTRLGLEPDLVVVGEAATGEEGLATVTDLQPDVAIIDLNLPDVDGISLVRELAVLAPNVCVLVLTMLDDDSVYGAIRAGARGYMLKDAEPAHIVAAIRSVATGGTVFSPKVAGRLLELTSSPESGVFPGLTLREGEILRLVADGLTNTEIGRRLGLSPKTVRNYVSNVIGKLHAADRLEVIQRARRAGLGPPETL